MRTAVFDIMYHGLLIQPNQLWISATPMQARNVTLQIMPWVEFL